MERSSARRKSKRHPAAGAGAGARAPCDVAPPRTAACAMEPMVRWRPCGRSGQASLGLPLAGHAQRERRCALLLSLLLKQAGAFTFEEPVDSEQFPLYHRLITTPMDIRSVTN
jgi:hypothetical protein